MMRTKEELLKLKRELTESAWVKMVLDEIDAWDARCQRLFSGLIPCTTGCWSSMNVVPQVAERDAKISELEGQLVETERRVADHNLCIKNYCKAGKLRARAIDAESEVIRLEAELKEIRDLVPPGATPVQWLRACEASITDANEMRDKIAALEKQRPASIAQAIDMAFEVAAEECGNRRWREIERALRDRRTRYTEVVILNRLAAAGLLHVPMSKEQMREVAAGVCDAMAFPTTARILRSAIPTATQTAESRFLAAIIDALHAAQFPQPVKPTPTIDDVIAALGDRPELVEVVKGMAGKQ